MQYESFCVNPGVYLPWLKSELESRGVTFVRRRVNSLDEACALAGERGAVINATGLGEYHSNSERCMPMNSRLRCTLPFWCGGYEGVSRAGSNHTSVFAKRH